MDARDYVGKPELVDLSTSVQWHVRQQDLCASKSVVLTWTPCAAVLIPQYSDVGARIGAAYIALSNNATFARKALGCVSGSVQTRAAVGFADLEADSSENVRG